MRFGIIETIARRATMAGAVLAMMIALATPAPTAAQGEVAGEATGSALAAAVGGAIGLAAGGYGNLAVVVLKARFGHYPHSFRDAFGWESTPILAGGATGVALGLISNDLLIPWVIGGTAGVGVGSALGYLYGTLAWGDPESRWADAAIGAAIGMAVGSTAAIAREFLGDDGDDIGGAGAAMNASRATVAIPLFRLSF